MIPSPIIGVIDLRDGRAVHAIAGRRTEYRSVKSDGVPEGDAIALANRYRRLGVRSCYVADLNAITGNHPHLELLAALSATFSEVLIDAGAFAPKAAKLVKSNQNVRLIVPTESFRSVGDWADACGLTGIGKVVMGLDVAGNELRSANASLGEKSLAISLPSLIENVTPWIQRAMTLGVKSVVVLDLAYVGTRRGAGTVSACEHLSRNWPTLELISGGGVYDSKDVEALIDAGCRSVLVATALHKDDAVDRLRCKH